MISVVIPTHDRADLVGRAIASVQAQTIEDLEILVVSDGSKDNTEDVVRAIAEKDGRVRYLGYPDAKGANYARNYAARAAKGEYLAFLDDDDEWFPEKLEKQMKAFSQNPKAGICYTGCHIIYTHEKVDYYSVPSDKGDLSDRVLLGNCIGTTSTVVVKKSVFDEAGGFDEALPALQDFELWIRICQLTEAAVVEEPLIHYYNYRNAAQISDSTAKYRKAFTLINEKHSALFARLSEEDKSEKRMNEGFLLANKALRNHSGKEARAVCRELLSMRFSKRAAAYYLLSFFPYKTALRFRRLAG